ncbi:MAG: ATP synthase F0 subunit B [Bdellovibrionales bacterium]|nr:ATP synthase F0 subunit B [Bdellovibrionales bacterium]
MLTILQQLGVDASFFWQFGIFLVLWFALSKIFFGPFHALIRQRHERMVEDREAAEKLVAQAEQKLEEYRRMIAAAKDRAKRESDAILESAKAEENKILGDARDRAKQITQDALRELEQQRSRLQAELEAQVETLASQVAAKVIGGGR